MHVVITYDTEAPHECIPKLRRIWDVHRRFDAPLTVEGGQLVGLGLGRFGQRDALSLELASCVLERD